MSAIGSVEVRDSLTPVTTFSDDAPPAAGPYLQTVSGRWVNPFDPDPEQLDAGDIARALANQCRFGGHSRVFYSVAQHCVIVSRVVEERGGDVEDVFAALMHDAGEAYLGDMPHPIKHRSALGAWHWPELEGVEPLDLELTAWSPDQAADEFAKRYAELEARRRAGVRPSQNITSTRG